MTLITKDGVVIARTHDELLDAVISEVCRQPCGMCKSTDDKLWSAPDKQPEGRLIFRLKCQQCGAVGTFDEKTGRVGATS